MSARGWLMLVLGACGFDGRSLPVDAPPDVPTDVGVDAPRLRISDGLVGLWTFDDVPGSISAIETSGGGSPVPLKVVASAPNMIVAPTFTGDAVVANARSRMISMPEQSRLVADIVSGGGVTLELWLRPAESVQGTDVAPRFVAGLAKNATTRSVALLQRGDRWLGLVRTNAALAGTPELVSDEPVTTLDYSHVVIVADAQSRRMFVDDRLAFEDLSPGPLTGWEAGTLLAVFEEPSGNRDWHGAISLVALYARAITPEEIHTNFVLGSEAR